MRNLVIMLKSFEDEPNVNVLPDYVNAYIGYCYNIVVDDEVGKVCAKYTFSDCCEADSDKLEFTEERVSTHCDYLKERLVNAIHELTKQVDEDFLNPNLGTTVKKVTEAYDSSYSSTDVWIVADDVCYPVNEWYRHLAREYAKDSEQEFTYYIGTVWEYFK